jgi:hypothetical protein
MMNSKFLSYPSLIPCQKNKKSVSMKFVGWKVESLVMVHLKT